MFLTARPVRLTFVITVFISAALFATLHFSPTSEAKTQAPALTHISGSNAIALNGTIGYRPGLTAQRALDNPKLINIQDGRELRTADIDVALAAGGMDRAAARPLTLATDDLNGDGLPDLIAGYSAPGGGFLIIYYGSERAFAPKGVDLQDQVANRFPEPFSRATLIRLDHAPDQLATGDFDRDGRVDILTAATGDDSLSIATGSRDGFLPSRSVSLGGDISALAAGAKTQPDIYGEIWVAIDGRSGSQLLNVGHNGSVFDEKVRSVDLPASATALAIGRLDEDRSDDVAVVAGGRLYISHSDGRTGWNDGVPPDAKAGTLEPVSLSANVTAVAISDFIWDRDERMELAVASDDGSVSILARGDLDRRPYTPEEASARRYLAAASHELRSIPTELANNNKTDGWRVAETPPAAVTASTIGGSRPILSGMLASAQNSYDLLALNSGARSVEIDYATGIKTGRGAARFSTAAEPVAVLPMRLNMHGHAGLVVLEAGKIEPTLMMFAPSAIFTVTKTTDGNDGTCNADCSLREAIVAANAAAGADTVSIPTNGNYQLTIGGDDSTSAAGDLDINSDITITGNGAANTFIQGSSSATFTGNMGDKIFGINQAGTLTAQIVTIQNLTVRFTRNDLVVNGNFSMTGGATDVFLTGAGASPGPTTTFTNVTYINNANSHSYGGAINIDSGDSGGVTTNVFRGTIQFTGSTVSTNATLGTAPADDPPTGGGLNIFGDKQNVTISSSTITGNTTPAAASANGGGINLRQSFGGTVTFNSSTAITSNTSGSDGGGLMIATLGGETFIMNGGSITGNTAQGTGDSADGGGLFNGNPVGSTTLTDVTISGNIATGGPTGRGGGVDDGSPVTMTINTSTISGNSADTGGGFYSAIAGPSSINTSTISGNTTVGGTGGGIAVGATGLVSLTSTTITNNTAVAGGGVHNTVGGVVNTRNTIIAADVSNNAIADTVGAFTSTGFNLVGNLGTATGFGGPSDQSGNAAVPLDPMLAPLANNGGPTQTHRIFSVLSPALDKGNAFALTLDQRGSARPSDIPGVSNTSDATDIGSFEAFGTTAAGVSVSGRVMTADGRGVRNASVVISDGSGLVLTVPTSSFGYYRFDNIQSGQTYLIQVASKWYQFTARTLVVADELTDVDFVAAP